jgi:hypothetical protein
VVGRGAGAVGLSRGGVAPEEPEASDPAEPEASRTPEDATAPAAASA